MHDPSLVNAVGDQRPADSNDAGDLRERLLRSRLFQGIPGPLVATVVAGSETRELAPGRSKLRRVRRARWVKTRRESPCRSGWHRCKPRTRCPRSSAAPTKRCTARRPPAATACTADRGTIPPVHFVYIVRCADGTLYTGYARDPRTREAVHNAGRGARYTSGRRPVSLVYTESYRSIGKALKREHALKRATRQQKEALIRSSSSEVRTTKDSET